MVATMATAPTVINSVAKEMGNVHDATYSAMLARIQERFARHTGPLFTTDVDLWPVYMGAFPADDRQGHNCHACRHFLRSFGGLATIDEQGIVASAIWHPEDEDDEYRGVLGAMAKAVRRAKVTGVHLSGDAVWGTPVTKQWAHMHVRPAQVFRHALLTPFQAMAEKKQDHENVMRALAEFTQDAVEQALTLLKTDAMYRSEKVIGPVQWLADLHVAAKNGNRSNVVWRAVATAPAGFCHPRSSMAGTLLEDIAAGLPFADVSRKFAAKMHPLQYQRPSAAPNAGQIEAAEKLVEKLGIAPALRRRFARLDECETTWRPTAPSEKTADGVFGHLRQQSVPLRADVPAQRITWTKFAATVLPEARTLAASISHGNMSFCALVTAADNAAPPILQWDREDARNPVSWYVYHNGSPASQWCVVPGWATVTAVVPSPTEWRGGTYKHQGSRALLVLSGCKDSGYQRAGNALFPECLKSELHGVRHVIEAYSRNATIEGYTESSACGLVISEKGETRVRATDARGNRIEYIVDRWD